MKKLLLLSLFTTLTALAMDPMAARPKAFIDQLNESGTLTLELELSQDNANEEAANAEIKRLTALIEKRFNGIAAFFNAHQNISDFSTLSKLFFACDNEMGRLRNLLYKMDSNGGFRPIHDSIMMQSFVGCLLNKFQQLHMMRIDVRSAWFSAHPYPKPNLNEYVHIAKSQERMVEGYTKNLVGLCFSVSSWFQNMRAYEAQRPLSNR